MVESNCSPDSADADTNVLTDHRSHLHIYTLAYLLSFPVPPASGFPQLPRGVLDRTRRRWSVLDGLPPVLRGGITFQRRRIVALQRRAGRVQFLRTARRRGTDGSPGTDSVEFVLLFLLLFQRLPGRIDKGAGEYRSFVGFDGSPRGRSGSHGGRTGELFDANDRLEGAGFPFGWRTGRSVAEMAGGILAGSGGWS